MIYQFQTQREHSVTDAKLQKKVEEKKRPKLTNHGTAADSTMQFTFKLCHLLAEKGTAAFTPADGLQGRKITNAVVLI